MTKFDEWYEEANKERYIDVFDSTKAWNAAIDVAIDTVLNIIDSRVATVQAALNGLKT